jgi:hypothetical protein
MNFDLATDLFPEEEQKFAINETATIWLRWMVVAYFNWKPQKRTATNHVSFCKAT